MKKILFSMVLIMVSSTLFAKEGKVVIHYKKSEKATLYVDGKKSISLTSEVTPLMLEEGNHILKLVSPISTECRKYEQKEIYVSSSGSLKVTFTLKEKLEPTTSYKKILDKKDNIKFHRFYRDEANIVKDKKLKLMWQDDLYPSRTKRDWKGANKYCQELKFSTFDDWRLPRYQELLAIVDYDRYNPAIVPLFKKTFSHRYWTSSPDVSSPDYVWIIDFEHGKTTTHIKSRRNYVRCVREESK